MYKWKYTREKISEKKFKNLHAIKVKSADNKRILTVKEVRRTDKYIYYVLIPNGYVIKKDIRALILKGGFLWKNI